MNVSTDFRWKPCWAYLNCPAQYVCAGRDAGWNAAAAAIASRGRDQQGRKQGGARVGCVPVVRLNSEGSTQRSADTADPNGARARSRKGGEEGADRRAASPERTRWHECSGGGGSDQRE